jgi:hypothetical protein
MAKKIAILDSLVVAIMYAGAPAALVAIRLDANRWWHHTDAVAHHLRQSSGF